MKKATLLFCLMVSGTLLAQTPLLTLADIKAGENFPQAMPGVKKWIETTLDRKFAANFQFSTSTDNSAVFYSLSLASIRENKITLPNTGDVRLKFATRREVKGGPAVQLHTQDIPINIGLPIRSVIRNFNAGELTFSPKEYYDTALYLSGIGEEEVLYNALRTLNDLGNKESYRKFIDETNRIHKTILPYLSENSPKALYTALKDAGLNSDNVVYEIVIDDKPAKALSAIDEFFAKAGYSGSVIKQADKLRTLTLSAGFATPEALELPQSIATSMAPGSVSPVCDFMFSRMEAALDYKAKTLTLTFTGNKQPVHLVTAQEGISGAGTGFKPEWKAVSHVEAELAKMVLVVGEKNIILTAFTEDGRKQYKLLENKIN